MEHNLEAGSVSRQTQYFRAILMGVSAFVVNTTYSYIEPFMNRVGALSENAVTFILLLFGGAGLIGSVIFSRWSERSTTMMMLASIILILGSMLLMLRSVKSIWLFSVITVIWGTAMMLLMLTVQSKVIEIDINAQDMVMAMFSGVIMRYLVVMRSVIFHYPAWAL